LPQGDACSYAGFCAGARGAAEFAARRGSWPASRWGIAVILGAEAYSYPVRFRQSPDLYDLTA
jgi:hypothetical protein